MNIANAIYHVKKDISLQKILQWGTLLFYILLLLFNPSNKIILIFTFAFIGILFVKTKSLGQTLLYSYFITSIIHTGKQHDIIIIPPGIFPIEFYPLGYYISFIITPSAIIAFFLLLLTAKKIFLEKGKQPPIRLFDIILIAFYFWGAASAIIGSKRPDVSMLAFIASLPELAVYLYIRFIAYKEKSLFTSFLWIVSSILLTESIMSFIQFASGAPFGFSIESTKGIELFGEAADELAFRFRPLGTFDHANSYGLFLMIYLPLLFYSNSNKRTPFDFFSVIMGSISLIMTLSRSAWLGFSTAMMFQIHTFITFLKIQYNALKLWIKIILFINIFIIFSIFILPRIQLSFFSFDETGGGYVRKQQISIAFELIKRSPLFGVGAAMSVPESLEIDTSGLLRWFPSPVHNYFILISAERGIPTIILYISFFVIMGIAIRKQCKKQNKTKLFSVYIGILCAIMIANIFQPYEMIGYGSIISAIIYAYTQV